MTRKPEVAEYVDNFTVEDEKNQPFEIEVYRDPVTGALFGVDPYEVDDFRLVSSPYTGNPDEGPIRYRALNL